LKNANIKNSIFALKIHPVTDADKLRKAAGLVNAGTERVIELWNIVLMRYNRTGPRDFSPLPMQVVDTGMGLERLSAVLNSLESNYDSDQFLPLFDCVHRFSKSVPHYLECSEKDVELLSAYRMLSDHMRSVCVAISDGLMPSRNGLGGFLKFLILKCMSVARESFGVTNETDLLCEMASTVVDSLAIAYPELTGRKNYIQEVRHFVLLSS
jgi:alanyl-tRNA synthetase